MPVIEIITIVFAAITIYLCYDEYKKGKMSLRNFKIVSICESLAILGMIFLIICCCGYFTYNVPANEDCGYICPVCFWENDPFIASDNEPSDSNHGITLKEAKSNFSKFGACEKEMLCYVRPPRDDEKEIS